MTIPDETWTHLIQVCIGGILLWVVRTVQQLTIEMRAFRVTLFGENGDNGLNSNVKQLWTEKERHDDVLSQLRLDIARMRERCGINHIRDTGD